MGGRKFRAWCRRSRIPLGHPSWLTRTRPTTNDSAKTRGGQETIKWESRFSSIAPITIPEAKSFPFASPPEKVILWCPEPNYK
ncbi:hypothetical protein JTE90_021955 [Oedothorax gibbosus]|uniref:Uncharacterized protein n=1 Tax=Oedothorax gibbosus TaxID=931172 RepID=A0AAV6V3F6_9ARAC|nr:hypothetical protein JTE90_021955 [Oedothorax gibbosus]